MRYRVKAIQGYAAPVELEVEGESPASARTEAERAGYDVLDVRRSWSDGFRTGRHGAALDIVAFGEELIALLDAGLALVDAIDTLGRRAPSASQRNALSKVVEHLRRGARLATALEASGALFPPLFVAAVRASEGTGTLTDALARYVAYEKQLQEARSRIASASIYPLLLLAVGGAVMLFLLAYVVPRFSRLYKEVAADLPWGSRMLMELGVLIDGHAGLVLGLFLGIVGAGFVWLRRPSSHRALLQIVERLPGIGARARLFELARLYRTLGLLLRSGVSMLTALGLAREVVSHALALALAQAIDAIRQGQPVSHAFESHGLTTEVAARMLVVAERTGALSDMLERIAAFHERELTRWLERATRLFEPVLMAVIGVLIGIVVVLMYMPIFDLAGSLG